MDTICQELPTSEPFTLMRNGFPLKEIRKRALHFFRAFSDSSGDHFLKGPNVLSKAVDK
ncbi:hypothetical protein Plhal710r2_c002g0006881 [Plasmopara halstedii]